MSCSEENPDQIVPIELVGTWNAMSLEFTRISDPSQVIEAISEREYTSEIVINADGSTVTIYFLPQLRALFSTYTLQKILTV